MAHESPNPWTITLPAVLLGVRSAVKELLGRSAAEMIYGTTLARLIHRTVHRRRTYRLRQLFRQATGSHVASPIVPTAQHTTKDNFQYKELETFSHVFLRRIAIASSLTATYDGPYKVISKSGRVGH